MKNFYVDDLLNSTSDDQSAISLIRAVTKMCKAGEFKLVKFISNSTVVLKSLEEDQRKKGVKDADPRSGELPVERALGVQWNIDEDIFGFKIAAEGKALTRRGLLSTLSTVYDPFGFVAPFILGGCIIIKNYAKKTVLGMNQRMNRTSGKKNLGIQKKSRWCDVSNQKGIYYISDASVTGYAQAIYLQLVSQDSQIHCSLLIEKSRVTRAK